MLSTKLSGLEVRRSNHRFERRLCRRDDPGGCSKGAVQAPFDDRDTRGFSLAELLVVVGVVGILAAAGVPYFITYLQSAKLRGGAEELATIVNQGRQLAINNNCTVTATQSSNRVQLSLGTNCPRPAYCASLPCNWRGPGTDTSGNFTLANDDLVTAATASPVFNFMGAATTTGTFTVTNPTNGRTLSVVVASSGRVSIQ
jgi:prepilin-type N-terminal cleavage/methylation domain-containing protein